MRGWPFLIIVAACKVRDPAPITTDPWTDTFERNRLGEDYYSTGKGYQISDGALSAHGAHNHPLWLRKKLPHDVRVEFDCWSTEQRGDIKIELFGDGHSYDPDGGAYMASGYEVIFGGWYNQKSIIARMDEHGHDMSARTDIKVVPKQRYHWKVERRGTKVSWWIDGKDFLSYDDPHALEGAGHEYLGFNNWETDTWFDNLVVTQL
jgi:hypothetical protein